MPAHRIAFDWGPDGALHAPDYGVIVPPELVEKIRHEGLGASVLAREIGVTRSRAQMIVEEARLNKPRVDIGGPSARPPRVVGVSADDHRPDPEEVYRRALEDYNAARDLIDRKARQEVAFDGGAVCIVFVADTHFGGRGVDVERAFHDARLVRDTPGMYAWFAGDLVDNFIVGKLLSIRFTTHVTIPEEWTLGRHYLSQFGEDLLAVTGGNHDAWTSRIAGLDALLDIVPGRVLYDPDEIVADIRIGDFTASVIVRHKWRGYSMYNPFHGQTRGAKFERPEHDIYVGAHTHTLGGYSDHPHAGRVIGLVQCGTYKVIDRYQREAGFPATTHTAPVAVIIHEDGWWTGTSNLEAAAAMMRTFHDRTGKRAA